MKAEKCGRSGYGSPWKTRSPPAPLSSCSGPLMNRRLLSQGIPRVIRVVDVGPARRNVITARQVEQLADSIEVEKLSGVAHRAT